RRRQYKGHPRFASALASKDELTHQLAEYPRARKIHMFDPPILWGIELSPGEQLDSKGHHDCSSGPYL
ncbi:MAG: hypothetical protein R3245_12040, partial [Kiloniellales bacterium]|nr:hypothetical protein [Kiloniellales bacterium]